MIISLEKINQHWTILIKKSHLGRTLQEFKLSKDILLRIAVDHLVNLNNGKGYFMKLDSNQGPYVLRLVKVQQAEEVVEDVIEEVVAPSGEVPSQETLVQDSIESETMNKE